MADLVVSYLVQTPHGNPYGHRIWADGKAEGYQVSKPVRKGDGSFEYQSVEPGFYPIATLSAQQVESLKREVNASGLSDLEGDVRAKGASTTDAGSIEWQIAGEGGKRTIRIAPWPAADGEPLSSLVTLIQHIGETILAAQAEALK